MNFHISASQAHKIACEIVIADVKKFITDHPEEYQLYLEGKAMLTSDAENKFIKKGA